MNASPIRTLTGLLLLMTACQRHEEPLSENLQQKIHSLPADKVRVYPSGEVLPANHLKFYIDFPEPMARGDIFDYFSLTENGSNKTVQDPFREVELWDESVRRLTLWFHPGRQKPGVNLNVEIGPILEEGKSYTLTVSGDWHTESGQPLGNNVRKSFLAAAIDHSQPDPATWQYTLPTAGTNQPFTITFPQPLDYALIPRTIQIQSESNPQINYKHNDQSIQFTTGKAWKAGKIIISVDTKLEDLAGNSIARPFNLDLQSTLKLPESSEFTKTFEIK